MGRAGRESAPGIYEGAWREMSYHAARALLADEASSSAAGMGLVNVSIEESYQVNEDAFHDRIIKVRIPRPAQRLRLRSHARLSADGFIFPDAASRRSLALTSPFPKPLVPPQSRRRSPRMSRTSSSPPSP